MICDCELRNRAWDPNTGRCRTCGRRYEDARDLPKQEAEPGGESTREYIERAGRELREAQRDNQTKALACWADEHGRVVVSAARMAAKRGEPVKRVPVTDGPGGPRLGDAFIEADGSATIVLEGPDGERIMEELRNMTLPGLSSRGVRVEAADLDNLPGDPNPEHVRRFKARMVAPDLNADLTGQALDEAAERIAQAFHEAYEAAAPTFGYKTREASAVPWAEVPAANRGLMVATARRLLQARVIVPGPDLDADEDPELSTELPPVDLNLTVREVREPPRKLNMTIDTRSRCGWLQTMTHGLTVWSCDALSGDLQGDGWELMLVSGWGLPVCPLHRDGGEKRQEALVGLRRVRRPKPPEETDDE